MNISIVICLFAFFVGICFGIYNAFSLTPLNLNMFIKEFGKIITLDFVTSFPFAYIFFDFMSDNCKIVFVIIVFATTVLSYCLTAFLRYHFDLKKENKLLKSQSNDELFLDICEKKIKLTQEKIDEISCVARKIAEFEDELDRNKENLLNAMENFEIFLKSICLSLVNKFFNNSDIQIYVKDIDNNLIIGQLNTNKLKVEKSLIEYDYGKKLLNNGKPIIASLNGNSKIKKKTANGKDVYIIPIIIAEEPKFYILIYINDMKKFINTVYALNFMIIEEKISKKLDEYQLNISTLIEDKNKIENQDKLAVDR